MLYNDKRKIAKTITINFFDFCYYDTEKYHRKEILNKFRTIDFTEEEAEVHLIELPKFDSNGWTNLTRKEQWIAYLKGDDINLINKIKKNNSCIKQLDKQILEYWKNEKI